MFAIEVGTYMDGHLTEAPCMYVCMYVCMCMYVRTNVYLEPQASEYDVVGNIKKTCNLYK